MKKKQGLYYARMANGEVYEIWAVDEGEATDLAGMLPGTVVEVRKAPPKARATFPK